MPALTATSDFGTKDPTLALLKSRFVGHMNAIEWVDISHEIEPHNTFQAAFVLGRIYKQFPVGTVHMIFVETEPRQGRRYLCIKANGHYFISANNGIIASIVEKAKVTASVSLELEQNSTFQVFDLFAKAALHLLGGGKVNDLGPTMTKIKRFTNSHPTVYEKAIHGIVVYIDHFGTCVTNIKKELVESNLNGRKLKIESWRNRQLNKIHEKIGDVNEGHYAAFWDENEYLCLVVGKSGGNRLGGSNDLLGLRLNDWVRIDFL